MFASSQSSHLIILKTCPATEIKWKGNEWGFRPHLCTCRLNCARRTSWGWWNEWVDTALQKQDLKFEPWQSEVELATPRSRRFPTLCNLYEWAGKNILFLWNLNATAEFEPAISDFPSRQLQRLKMNKNKWFGKCRGNIFFGVCRPGMLNLCFFAWLGGSKH